MSLSRCSAVVALLVGITVLLPATNAQDKDKDAKTEKVRLTTADGVELQGTFYPAAKTITPIPPAVLLLHAMGEDSKSAAWVQLAVKLQKAGFAVLNFDFRGHGASTELSDPK